MVIIGSARLVATEPQWMPVHTYGERQGEGGRKRESKKCCMQSYRNNAVAVGSNYVHCIIVYYEPWTSRPDLWPPELMSALPFSSRIKKLKKAKNALASHVSPSLFVTKTLKYNLSIVVCLARRVNVPDTEFDDNIGTSSWFEASWFSSNPCRVKLAGIQLSVL